MVSIWATAAFWEALLVSAPRDARCFSYLKVFLGLEAMGAQSSPKISLGLRNAALNRINLLRSKSGEGTLVLHSAETGADRALQRSGGRRAHREPALSRRRRSRGGHLEEDLM